MLLFFLIQALEKHLSHIVDSIYLPAYFRHYTEIKKPTHFLKKGIEFYLSLNPHFLAHSPAHPR